MIPKRVEERIRSSFKKFIPVLQAQRDRDVSEADTVTLVKDLLADLFGFDKYTELTGEYAIRGTYCDLAIKIEGKLRLLVEVKAIGVTLAERHIKQAVDYASNQGLDFVVLTNAGRWMLYQVVFKKPIASKLVAEFDLLGLDAKKETDLEQIFLLTREGILKGAVKEFAEKKDATSRFLLAALITSDEDALNAIRRELRKATGILVPSDTIAQVLRQEVVKRECLEGDEAAEALRVIARAAKKQTAATDRCDEVVQELPTPAAAPANASEGR